MNVEYYDYFKVRLNDIAEIAEEEFFPSILDKDCYCYIKGEIGFAVTFNLITFEQKKEIEEELLDLARLEPWYIKEYGEDTEEDRQLRKNLRAILDKAECEGIRDLEWTSSDYQVFISKRYEIAVGEYFDYSYTIDKELIIYEPEEVLNELIKDFELYVKCIEKIHGMAFR